jgi:hypothetical protein
MNLQPDSTTLVEYSSPRNGSKPRPQRRRLVLARTGWIALTLVLLVLNAVVLPRFYSLFQTICLPGAPCPSPELSPQDVGELHRLGLTPGFLANYRVLFEFIVLLIYDGVAALIFWRCSAERMALFSAYMLVLMGSGGLTSILSYGLGTISLAWNVLVSMLTTTAFACLFAFCYLFPSGRFVPRWSSFGVPLVVLYGLMALFPDRPTSVTVVGTMLLLAALFTALVTQVYRYRRVSTPVERQQTKLVVFGLSLTLGGFVLFIGLLYVFVPQSVMQSSVAATLLAGTGVYICFLLFPIFLVMAILRSRLWDIDIIINRTLVYGTLSALLAGLYAGLIIGLEGLLGLFTGQENQPVVFVVSTLVIATLFHRLRQRIQNLIDRRFYRRKYDAAKVLEAFSVALRSEVDLSQLSELLLSVVEETMQPTSVSLWLRPPAQRGNRQVLWRATPAVSSEHKGRDDQMHRLD